MLQRSAARRASSFKLWTSRLLSGGLVESCPQTPTLTGVRLHASLGIQKDTAKASASATCGVGWSHRIADLYSQ